MVVTAQNKLALLLQTLRQVSGFNALQQGPLESKHAGVVYFQTRELTIKNPSGAPLHIDGDPTETAEEFTIKVLPQCYKLITPTP